MARSLFTRDAEKSGRKFYFYLTTGGRCGLIISSANNEHQNNMKALTEIKAIIANNREAGAYTYENLDSSEIGKYNGWLMHGDDDEAFPSALEWSMIAD